jgi:hypothetical protein
MGCDIHSFAEVRGKGSKNWKKVTDHFSLDNYDKERSQKDKGDNPFYWQDYKVFAFLAGVRNYTNLQPISKPKGLPMSVDCYILKEYKKWFDDAHNASYLTLKELMDFDYNQIASNSNTYKDVLGSCFFEHLEELKLLGEPENVRIVFWFDN